jgi:hypothetical protein
VFAENPGDMQKNLRIAVISVDASNCDFSNRFFAVLSSICPCKRVTIHLHNGTVADHDLPFACCYNPQKVLLSSPGRSLNAYGKTTRVDAREGVVDCSAFPLQSCMQNDRSAYFLRRKTPPAAVESFLRRSHPLWHRFCHTYVSLRIIGMLIFLSL